MVLALALEAARRFSAHGPTLLVDLGATQDWFTDIVDRQETDGVVLPGLADLLAGRARFDDVIRRDLSSSLDVIASGGAARAESFADMFAALQWNYKCVILHASDWRSPLARAAAQFVDAVAIVAPEGRMARAFDAARRDLGDLCPQIVPFAVSQAAGKLEQAA
jgi:hypothetical protein